MWLDAIALLVLGIFAGMGMLRGGLATAMGLLSLAVAYAAAIATASRFGPEVARWIGLPEFLGLARMPTRPRNVVVRVSCSTVPSLVKPSTSTNCRLSLSE